MLLDSVLVANSEVKVGSMPKCRTIDYWYKTLICGIVASRLNWFTLMLVFSLSRVAGHPLAQNERCLHMFLQDEVIDKNYTPSKIRHT